MALVMDGLFSVSLFQNSLKISGQLWAIVWHIKAQKSHPSRPQPGVETALPAVRRLRALNPWLTGAGWCFDPCSSPALREKAALTVLWVKSLSHEANNSSQTRAGVYQTFWRQDPFTILKKKKDCKPVMIKLKEFARRIVQTFLQLTSPEILQIKDVWRNFPESHLRPRCGCPHGQGVCSFGGLVRCLRAVPGGPGVLLPVSRHRLVSFQVRSHRSPGAAVLKPLTDQGTDKIWKLEKIISVYL